MGYPGPIIDAPPNEVSDLIKTAINEVKREIQGAESSVEVFLIIAKATTPSADDDDSQSNTQHNHFGRTFYQQLLPLLDTIDDITDTQYHNEFTEFAEQLSEQEYFSQISGLLLIYALSDVDYMLSYANSYTQQVVPLWEEIVELSEADSNHPNDLLPLYRQWGGLAEDALPPVVAIIKFLKNGEVDFEKVRGLSLANHIETIESFHLLPTIGKNLDSDIRNSVSHGGPGGGPNINPVQRTISFQYENDGNVETREMSFSEFEEHTFQTLGTVTALFIFPIFLLAVHSCISVDKWTKDKKQGEAAI